MKLKEIGSVVFGKIAGRVFGSYCLFGDTANKKHNSDGPALIWRNSDGKILRDREYWIHGRLFNSKKAFLKHHKEQVQ